jgi:hypothetical protein
MSRQCTEAYLVIKWEYTRRNKIDHRFTRWLAHITFEWRCCVLPVFIKRRSNTEKSKNTMITQGGRCVMQSVAVPAPLPPPLQRHRHQPNSGAVTHSHPILDEPAVKTTIAAAHATCTGVTRAWRKLPITITRRIMTQRKYCFKKLRSGCTHTRCTGVRPPHVHDAAANANRHS